MKKWPDRPEPDFRSHTVCLIKSKDSGRLSVCSTCEGMVLLTANVVMSSPEIVCKL